MLPKLIGIYKAIETGALALYDNNVTNIFDNWLFIINVFIVGLLIIKLVDWQIAEEKIKKCY